MTRGISEERLRELQKNLSSCTGYHDREVEYLFTYKLLKECTELNPWMPIDENTPKDRPLFLLTEKYGPVSGKWFDGTNSWTAHCVAIYPTHFCELPDDPK